MSIGGVARTAGAVVLAFGLAAAWKTAEPMPWRQPRTPAEQEAYNRVIFDRVWTTLDQRHFAADERRAGWLKAYARFQPAARAAKDAAGLYYQVLTPMLLELDQSHVGVEAPDGVLKRALSQEGLVLQSFTFSPGAALWDQIGILFDQTGAVADLRPEGAAAKAGVELGWELRAFRSDPKGLWNFQFSDRSGALREVRIRSDDTGRSGFQATQLGDVLLIRFDAFERAQVDAVLDAFERAPPKGVVLDLRTNTGGRVYQERRLLSALLPEDALLNVTVAKGRRSERRSWGDQSYRGPLVVLIGGATASAGEVTASTLAFHRRARLIGAVTAGAVLTSNDIVLPDGGVLTLPVQQVLDPAGRPLEGVGVTPHVAVSPTLEAVRAGRDLALEAALAELTALS